MHKLFILSLLSVIVFACADLKKEQLTQKVAKLEHELLVIEEGLIDDRMNTISSIKINTMQTELRIKQNLHLDTINLELSKQLDAYKLMRKNIKPMMQDYLKVRNGIKEEKQVLKRLAKDIEEGRGERNRYPEYIRFERQKVKQIALLAADFSSAKNQLFKDYETLYPPVEAFSQSLLKKNQNR